MKHVLLVLILCCIQQVAEAQCAILFKSVGAQDKPFPGLCISEAMVVKVPGFFVNQLATTKDTLHQLQNILKTVVEGYQSTSTRDFATYEISFDKTVTVLTRKDMTAVLRQLITITKRRHFHPRFAKEFNRILERINY